MADLRSCARGGDPKYVAQWHQVCAQGEEAKRQWVTELRAQGFKAAHPNDGHVDRERFTLVLQYPQFNDGAGPGDLVMLGSPSGDCRPVRLIEVAKVAPLTGKAYFHFADEPPPLRPRQLPEPLSALLKPLRWLLSLASRSMGDDAR